VQFLAYLYATFNWMLSITGAVALSCIVGPRLITLFSNDDEAQGVRALHAALGLLISLAAHGNGPRRVKALLARRRKWASIFDQRGWYHSEANDDDDDFDDGDSVVGGGGNGGNGGGGGGGGGGGAADADGSKRSSNATSKLLEGFKARPSSSQRKPASVMSNKFAAHFKKEAQASVAADISATSAAAPPAAAMLGGGLV
jgi:hypothetical protein